MTALLLRLLLRLAPASFRDRYGPEILSVHTERARAARGLDRARAGGREVLGLVWVVVKLRFGGRPGDTRTRGGGTMFEGILQDLRFAVRGLRRNPGFTAAAVAILALGLGANTAIFSAANAFFFRPLPFADAGRIVMLYETNPEFGWEYQSAAPANVLDWREQVGAFDDVAVYSEFTFRTTWIRPDGEPVLFEAATVSGNFFDVLGVHPALGRTFRWDETWTPDDDVVMLGHDLWTTEFGADPGVVGRTLELGSRRLEVVGVLPEGFSFPSSGTQIWTTFGWAGADRGEVWFRRAHWVRPLARLAPDLGLEEADAQLQGVVRRLSADYPETNRVMGAGLMPARAFLTRDVRTRILLLGGAVLVLLVLACANVANLVLVRSAGRGREIALRRALGARPGRVGRLVLTESLLLAGSGGALGLGLGWIGVRLMQRLTPLGIDGATRIALDARVVAFVAAASVAAGVLFGLVPALRTSAGRVHEALKEGGGRGTAGRARGRLVNGLVALEVGLALLLVVGAGLMVRSFVLLRSVDPGFRTEGTLAVRFNVPAVRYAERDLVLAFQDELLERLEASPGILDAGSVAQLPLTQPSWSSQMQAEGWPADRVAFEVLHRRADNGYFEALGIPLVRGRLFGPGDRAGAPPVILVNETFARMHFPGEDPIGKRVANDRAAASRPDDVQWYEIVGVVGDQHQTRPGEPPRPEVFESRHQDWERNNWVVLRTDGDPLAAVPVVRSVLREMDGAIALGDVRPLSAVRAESMARERFLLVLLTFFGTAAMLVAAVGVYGVTAQAARARTQEIGIRMALGAGAPAVVGMMLRQGMAVVAVGLLVGVAISLVAARAMAGVLYGVEPTDPATIGAVVALLAAVAAVACWVPARRATRVDPVRSLGAQ